MKPFKIEFIATVDSMSSMVEKRDVKHIVFVHAPSKEHALIACGLFMGTKLCSYDMYSKIDISREYEEWHTTIDEDNVVYRVNHNGEGEMI